VQRATAGGDQHIGLVTPSTLAGRVEHMPTSDRASADAHATAARQAIEQGRSSADPIRLATAEALMAIFHQLRDMEDPSITLKGAADLSNAMYALANKFPDR
jgi:hypothetical protein